MLVPGVSGLLRTSYSLFPWFGVFVLGIIFGRRLGEGGPSELKRLRYLGLAYLLNDQVKEAEALLKEVVKYATEYELDWAGMPARLFLGTAMIAKGKINQGFKMIDVQHTESQIILIS